MISNREPAGNPIGPETPTYQLPLSRWQVVAGLLLIAILLTVWRQYEIRFVAPKTPVAWQTFDLELLQQARRDYRDVLISVIPGDKDQATQHLGVTSGAGFQRAVFLNRPVAFLVESVEALPDEARDWLTDSTPDILRGGLAWLPQADLRRQRSLSGDQVVRDEAVALINGSGD